MARATGMIVSQGMEVGCPIGMRLWMNHIGCVFPSGGLAPPLQSEKNKANVIHPKPQPNGTTNLHPLGCYHPNGSGHWDETSHHCDDHPNHSCVKACMAEIEFKFSFLTRIRNRILGLKVGDDAAEG